MATFINRLSIPKSVISLAAIGVLFMAFIAYAGVAGSTGPTYPTTVAVGSTTVPVSLQITNNSTAPQSTETVLVTDIFHTPSCGDDISAICSGGQVDPGVFQVVGPATGRAGTACAGTTFTIGTPNATTGEVQFTPNTPVVLGPSNVGGLAATCIIDFAVNVIDGVDVDASVAAGMQTSQLARVRFTAQTSGVEGSGSGSSRVTVTEPGHIIVNKVTNPSGATTTFSFNATGTGYTNFTLTDTQAPNDQTLNAGTYSVGETLPSGWTQSSATCVSSNQDTETPGNISLQNGETVTCTFTNTQDGRIIVDKVTDPAGSTQSFAFTTTGTGFNGFSLTDTATPNNQVVAPGAYTLSETPVSGWTQTSAVCDQGETPGSLDVGAGETVTCTFTNTLQGGTLIVQKTTLPAGDDTDFSIMATGTGSITGGGAGMISDDTDKSYSVTAGTYSVTETIPDGWNQTSNTCTNVVVSAGETETCVITNTKRGTLIVDKVTLPAGASTTFSIMATGNGTITGGGAGTVTDANSKTYEVTPGTYSVSETIPTGWTQTSNTCTGVVVSPGETETCTITNTEIVEVQYCSPGYWKQSQHFDSWVTYAPTDLFSTVFGESITILWSAKGKPMPVTNPTLLQVLEGNGGGITSLARAAVGALLNASALDSGMTTGEVIDLFQDTNPNGDFEAAKAAYTAEHNCPLN